MQKRVWSPCENHSRFFRGAQKRAMSTVVASVLVILIVVVSVALVWFVVLPIVSDAGFGVGPGDVSVVTSEGYTVYDSEAKLASVQLRRGDDDAELNSVDVIFSVEGESVKFTIPKGDILEKNSVKLYKFDLSEGVPDSVKVVPAFAVGSGSVTGNVVVGGLVIGEARLKVGTVDKVGAVYDLDEEGNTIRLNFDVEGNLVLLMPESCLNILEGLMSICTCEDAQGMIGDREGDYFLANDIDCSDTVNWNDGAGFVPIGDYVWVDGNDWCEHSDFDKDGDVDDVDFDVVVANFGRAVVPYTNGDVNGDGLCDLDDFAIVRRNSGSDNCSDGGYDDSVAFSGEFDGQGYSVNNLYIEGSEVDSMELFGYVSGAAIVNFDSGRAGSSSSCRYCSGKTPEIFEWDWEGSSSSELHNGPMAQSDDDPCMWEYEPTPNSDFVPMTLKIGSSGIGGGDQAVTGNVIMGDPGTEGGNQIVWNVQGVDMYYSGWPVDFFEDTIDCSMKFPDEQEFNWVQEGMDCRGNKVPVIKGIAGGALRDDPKITSLVSRGVVYAGEVEHVTFEIEDESPVELSKCNIAGSGQEAGPDCSPDLEWTPVFNNAFSDRVPVKFTFTDDGRFEVSSDGLEDCERETIYDKNILTCPEPKIIGAPDSLEIYNTGDGKWVSLSDSNSDGIYTGWGVDVVLSRPCGGYGWRISVGDDLSVAEDVCGLQAGKYKFSGEDGAEIRVNGNDEWVSVSGVACEDIADECASGDTRPCRLQGGVCRGSVETCERDGTWWGCREETYEEYSNGAYELSEKITDDAETSGFCTDDIDNDCDEEIDCADNTDCDGERYLDTSFGGCRMCSFGDIAGPNRRPIVNSVESEYTGENSERLSKLVSKKVAYVGIEEKIGVWDDQEDEDQLYDMICDIYGWSNGISKGALVDSVFCFEKRGRSVGSAKLLWTPNDKTVDVLKFKITDTGAVVDRDQFNDEWVDFCKVPANELTSVGYPSSGLRVKVCPNAYTSEKLEGKNKMNVKLGLEDWDTHVAKYRDYHDQHKDDCEKLQAYSAPQGLGGTEAELARVSGTDSFENAHIRYYDYDTIRNHFKENCVRLNSAGMVVQGGSPSQGNSKYKLTFTVNDDDFGWKAKLEEFVLSTVVAAKDWVKQINPREAEGLCVEISEEFAFKGFKGTVLADIGFEITQVPRV